MVKRSNHKTLPSLLPADEWVVGMLTIPSYVSDDGEPYRPRALVWLHSGAVILRIDVDRDDGVLRATAGVHFRSATQKPIFGPPHKPRRVRVDDEILADMLERELAPEVEIVRGPTPELADVAAALVAGFDEQADEPADFTYFGPGIAVPALRSFFAAAAALYREAPWSVVPDDTTALFVTSEALGIEDGAISVVGQAGTHFGFALFDSVDDLDRFACADIAGADERGDAPPSVPAHGSLSFGEESQPTLRREIKEHDLEVANRRAVPSLLFVDSDLVPRGPTARELTRFEAVARALAVFVKNAPDFDEARERRHNIEMTASVATSSGKVDVGLSTRPWRGRAHDEARAPIGCEPLLAAITDGGELDDVVFAAHKKALLASFARSPEAAELASPLDWSALVIDLGAQYFGETLVMLRPHELDEILFEVFPAKVVISDAMTRDAAQGVVDELRAMFRFLSRELGSRSTAQRNLRVLDDGAASRLARALTDEDNYGWAKQLAMQGARAGLDLSTEDGLKAWMRELERPTAPAPRKIKASGPKASQKKREEKKPAKTKKPKAMQQARRKRR